MFKVGSVRCKNLLRNPTTIPYFAGLEDGCAYELLCVYKYSIVGNVIQYLNNSSGVTIASQAKDIGLTSNICYHKYFVLREGEDVSLKLVESSHNTNPNQSDGLADWAAPTGMTPATYAIQDVSFGFASNSTHYTDFIAGGITISTDGTINIPNYPNEPITTVKINESWVGSADANGNKGYTAINEVFSGFLKNARYSKIS